MIRIVRYIGIAVVISVSACKTDEGTNPTVVEPTLTTNPVEMITGTTAVMGGNVTNEGSASVFQRGVAWSKNANPTTMDNFEFADGSGAGTFSVAVSGLEPNTTYNVRAFASSNVAMAFGNNVTFTTGDLLNMTTDIARNITSTDADLGGELFESGVTVDDRGVVYATNSNPTLDDFSISIGQGNGAFSATATGLTPNTTYFVRPYGFASGMSYYGEEISFTTAGYFGPSGGYVVYDKGEPSDGWQYLEAATDPGVQYQFGCMGQFLSNTFPQLGKGPDNTVHIVANCSDNNCAARYCSNYSFGGFNDWFLPSSEEAKVAMTSLYGISPFLVSNELWSSTETSQNEAQYVFLANDEFDNFPHQKNFSYSVRPVRRY